MKESMVGTTKFHYLMDQREKGADLFESIREWDEAHPLPDDLFPSEDECWEFLDSLRNRGGLSASELRTLRFAVDELKSKVNQPSWDS